MLPIFNEYIQFLKDCTNNNKNLDILREGYYWLDNQIIKAFDREGKIHKIIKVNINNNLDVSIKPYKLKWILHVESWDETISRLSKRLNELEQYSIKLLQKYGINTDRKIICLNSTGKDSLETEYLAKKGRINF